MKIYNSLTKKKEEFTPINPGVINIYTCGVTVYDDCHIGHARSLYIFDVMRRYLEHRDYKVNFVRNITDIDDKIINRANELSIDWRELVDKYIASYKDDLESLGIREGLLDKDGEEPRATKNIPEMISYIAELIDKGYAYEADGDVYFDVRKFKEYGKLSGQDIDKVREGARISPGEKKKDALDFALWKRSKENEPWWESPWSKGRPGWHIECSVMSQRFLNSDTLDIHAGGRDLIFPHHENEVAQAQAKTGKTFANYWIHHGLLTIDAQKMSKSMGNFITIKDALKSLPDSNASDILKLLFLNVHYSNPLDYSKDNIEEAKTLMKWMVEALDGEYKKNDNLPSEHKDYINTQIQLFEQAMENDFNMPQARAVLFDLVRFCNRVSDKNAVIHARYIIRELGGNIFGLSFNEHDSHDRKWGSQSAANVMKDAEIEAKISEREKWKKQKKYEEADKIRKELEDNGIMLQDTSEGTGWQPI